MMWKRFGLFVFILSISTIVSLGQWSTNAWPTWEFTRQGSVWEQETFEAARERFLAANAGNNTGLSEPSAPSFWRSQRGDLIQFKGKVKSYVPYFIDWQVVDNATYQTNWLTWLSNTSFRVFPLMTATGLLNYAELPTNFFDYTPWRALSGLGPFTNDASVGHDYGWTNDTTAKGGSGFPAGRSVWYTTDYGWQGMKTTLDKMTHTTFSRKWSLGGGFDTATGGTWGVAAGITNEQIALISPRYTTWTNAESSQLEIWKTNKLVDGSPFFFPSVGHYSVGTYHGTDGSAPTNRWSANWYNQFASWQLQLIVETNTPAMMFDLFIFNDAQDGGFQGGLSTPVYIFKQNSSQMVSNDWTLYTGSVEYAFNHSGGTNIYSDQIGPNLGAKPSGTVDPFIGSLGSNQNSFTGWRLIDSGLDDPDKLFGATNKVLPLLDWTATTNGFAYTNN